MSAYQSRQIDGQPALKNAQGLLLTLQLRDIDAVISPSATWLKTYERAGLFRHKITVVPNGIDVARFQEVRRKKNHKEMRFSFIGHLGRHKGVRTIIEALHILMQKTGLG